MYKLLVYKFTDTKKTINALYRLGNDDNRTASMTQLALAAVWYADKRRLLVRLVGNSSVVFANAFAASSCHLSSIYYIASRNSGIVSLECDGGSEEEGREM